MKASEVWEMGWGARGEAINNALGANLPPNFPVIDRFLFGTATSIKSVDLTAGTYQSARRLLWCINKYVDQVAAFDGANVGIKEITSSEITGRALNLAIPRGSATAEQGVAIAAAKARAKNLGVDLIVTPF